MLKVKKWLQDFSRMKLLCAGVDAGIEAVLYKYTAKASC